MSELLYRTYIYDPVKDREYATYGKHRPLSESINSLRKFCRGTNSYENCMFIFKPVDETKRSIYVDTRFKVIGRKKFKEVANILRLKSLLGAT